MKYSCEDLQGSIYFAPNVLRNCCQRFFVNGERKGDVEIVKVCPFAEPTERQSTEITNVLI